MSEHRDPVELWDALLDRARQCFPAYIVELWFVVPVTPVEFDRDGALVVKVSRNHFAWVQKKYGPWLGKVIRELGASGLVLEREPVSA